MPQFEPVFDVLLVITELFQFSYPALPCERKSVEVDCKVGRPLLQSNLYFSYIFENVFCILVKVIGEKVTE